MDTLETEVNSNLDTLETKVNSNFVKKSGDTMTGTLNCQGIIPTVSSNFNLGSKDVRWSVFYGKATELFDSTPFIDFHYNNSTADYTARIIENSSGALTAYNSISNSSDKRLKNNIEDISEEYLDLFDKLEVKTYNFNNSELKEAGLIAQDVLELEKEAGIEDSVLIRGTGEEFEIEKDGETKTEIDYYSLNYSNLTALCVKKIQELTKQVEELNKEVESLKNEGE